MSFIQHCFVCHPSDSTVFEDVGVIRYHNLHLVPILPPLTISAPYGIPCLFFYSQTYISTPGR